MTSEERSFYDGSLLDVEVNGAGILELKGGYLNISIRIREEFLEEEDFSGINLDLNSGSQDAFEKNAAVALIALIKSKL